MRQRPRARGRRGNVGDEMRRSVRGIGAWAVVALVALPGTAGAGGAGQVAGTYQCVETGKTLALEASGKYSYGSKGGSFAYRAAKQKMSFKSGPLTAFYGRRVVDVNGGVDLYRKSNDRVKAHCIDSSGEPEF